jgi:hypothetical protein
MTTARIAGDAWFKSRGEHIFFVLSLYHLLLVIDYVTGSQSHLNILITMMKSS